MLCFVFFLVPVLSSPLVPVVAGVQTTEIPSDNSVVQEQPLDNFVDDNLVVQEPPLDNFVDDNSLIKGKASQNHLLDTASQHGFVQNLIKNPTLLSQFAKADPAAVNNIIDLLAGILEVSRNLSASLTDDVNDALIAKTAAEASWTTMVREKADAKTAAEAAYSTLARENAVKKASVDGESEAIIRAISLVRTLAAGDFERKNESGYSLFKMTATTGFTDDKAGLDKYVSICHNAGYLPVGCGSNTYHCNASNKYEGNECVEITGYCNVGTQIQNLTGWSPVITYQVNPATNFLAPGPSSSTSYIPVCGLYV